MTIRLLLNDNKRLYIKNQHCTQITTDTKKILHNFNYV